MSFWFSGTSPCDTVFNCKDLLVNIFEFFDIKEIKILRLVNKSFYLASDKYREELKFFCEKCEDWYIDYESYFEYTRLNDIHKRIYEEYIRDVIIKEFDKYLCKCCRSRCSNCLTVKNRRNLKYNTNELSYWYGNYVCRGGCEKKCDKCNKQIKNKLCRHFPKYEIHEDFLSIETSKDFLEDRIKNSKEKKDKSFVLSMIEENDVVCEKCLRNYNIYGNEY
jgi:hypothetical protein